MKREIEGTLNTTDVHGGWVFTRSVRNNAHVHTLGALKAGASQVLVNDRMNYLTPTKKPLGYGDHNGRRTRIYGTPQTPLDRLLAAGVLAPHRPRRRTAGRGRDAHRAGAINRGPRRSCRGTWPT